MVDLDCVNRAQLYLASFFKTFFPIILGNTGRKIFLMFVRIVFCSKYSINIIWSVLQQKLMEKTFCFTFFEFWPKSVARRCHNTLFVMILSDRQHKYTYIWLFYQLIYPFHWFCSPLMLKIHHFGGTRCDFGNSREPEWLKIENWRQLARIFKNSPILLKKLLQTCSWW